MAESSADYVIAGGGLSGCVIASRLSEAGFSVVLIESGPEDSSNPHVLAAASAFTLGRTDPHLLYQYPTTKQPSINDRTVGVQAGKVLGGGAAVNYAAWTRGHRADYDKWAELVQDSRWSYDELLPFFQRSEDYCNRTFPEQHGYGGPIKVCSGPRGYPLEEKVRQAMLAAGLSWNPDMNSGNPNGVARLIESWHGGVRQFAAKNYNLDRVQILTNAHVAKLIMQSDVVKGVELVNNDKIFANKEVILCCGAARTPQVLMLSGIGPQQELRRLGIPMVVDLPVGENLHDHGSLFLNFKLRNPEGSNALGSVNFTNPKFFEGAIIDFFATAAAPDTELREAATIDGAIFDSQPRSDYELACAYAPGPPVAGMKPPPLDGSISGWSLCCLSTTSRGYVTLKDLNPVTYPNINPDYFSTEHDRAVMRAGMRKVLEIAESEAGQAVFASEHPPDPSITPLTSGSTDGELDQRLRMFSSTFNHLSGTAAMGSVTDSHCRVKGIQKLRVIDASILPIPISAHLQAPLYGIAESAAAMLVRGD